MDIPLIQEELNEIRQANDSARQRLWVACQLITMSPISARTEIELAIETINRVKSRLEAVKIGMADGK